MTFAQTGKLDFMNLADVINPIHMRDYGLHMLAKGVLASGYSEIYNPYAHAIGAIDCASASEILLKARIAEVHPLLIFSKLPTLGPDPEDLSLLLERGRTVTYDELPNLLRVVHGYDLPNRDRYLSFGRLRNQLIHLRYPDEREVSEETLHFAFEVMEPILSDFWDESIFNYTRQFFESEENDEGLRETLLRLQISFSYPSE